MDGELADDRLAGAGRSRDEDAVTALEGFARPHLEPVEREVVQPGEVGEGGGALGRAGRCGRSRGAAHPSTLRDEAQAVRRRAPTVATILPKATFSASNDVRFGRIVQLLARLAGPKRSWTRSSREPRRRPPSPRSTPCRSSGGGGGH